MCGTEAQTEKIEVRRSDGVACPIRIGCGNLPELGAVLEECGLRGDVFLMSDHTVWGLHGRSIQQALKSSGHRLLDVFLIDPGEESKSLEKWGAALDRLAEVEDGALRRLFLMNFGGGVVGDLGGFVAASYRRGIPFVQVPTTLLAQVDSSVGGKTAVNHPRGKNLIGAFFQPVCVVIDLALLKTLPPRDFRAGFAEVLKYGLIFDEAFVSYLERNMTGILAHEKVTLVHIVKRCCEIKAEVVSRDEREKEGLRTLLNFGHTMGHALEAATQYRTFLHGEAVGIGMLCAAWISVALGMLRSEDYERIKVLLEAIGLETRARGVESARVWEAMKHDKKFIHGRNRFVLLGAIGKACVVEDVDLGLLSRALGAHLD